MRGARIPKPKVIIHCEARQLWFLVAAAMACTVSGAAESCEIE
jgi:hypothetical protein